MKESAKYKRVITYFVLITALVALIVYFRVLSAKRTELPQEGIPVTPTPVQQPVPETGVYDISKIKEPLSGSGASSLSQVYAEYPKQDAGKNMVELWHGVKPEDKARITEELDKEISASKKMLEEDPKNKKAKHELFIKETLRKLIDNGFDYRNEYIQKK